MLRMYDTGKGRITLDGHEIRDVDLGLLRKEISYVPQDVFLFSDTIANNIRFGLPDARPDLVEQAARYASIEKEIRGFADAYETMVGERGVTLSGGQKQRISIARALIKDPRIIIFDDCLSAVDAKTEKEILTNLNKYLKDKTAIIITHRILSLFDFDRIVVLEDGKVIEEGTHEQLMANQSYYAYLYEQQLQESQQESFSDNGYSRDQQ